MSSENDKKTLNLLQEFGTVKDKVEALAAREIASEIDTYSAKLDQIRYEYPKQELLPFDDVINIQPPSKSLAEMMEETENLKKNAKLLNEIEERIQSSRLSKLIADL